MQAGQSSEDKLNWRRFSREREVLKVLASVYASALQFFKTVGLTDGKYSKDIL